MKTTKVQMPDGRLIEIMSDNAEQIATAVAAKLTGNVLAANSEEALETPVLNFGKEDVQLGARLAPSILMRNVPVPAVYTNEQVLELPALNFEKARSAEADAAEAERARETNGEAPLGVPAMVF